MNFEEIRYEVADHVLTITLDRPDRLNAFTPTMARELIEAFDRSDADDDVRAVIERLAARERLLLVLPTGNLYEYFCQQCGTSTGSKTDSL